MDYDLTVLVVNFNTAHLLGEMFDALYRSVKNANLAVQVIVIDNASSDNSVELLRTKFPHVRLIVNKTNIGFGRANNLGIPYISGRYILLLNTDAFVSEDTLRKTVDYMDAHSRCGVLGVKLVGRDGQLQPSCRYFPTPCNLFLFRTGLSRVFKGVQMVDDLGWDHASVRQCDWVPGCYYLIRREVVDQIGLFDPRYFLYSEEVDHCKEVKKAGWEVIYLPETSVVHTGGESAKSAGLITSGGRQLQPLQVESEMLYVRKHFGVYMLGIHLMLSLLADLVLFLKQVARFRFIMALKCLSHSLLLLKKIAETHIGSISTR